jgi:hypothetical protein
MPSQQLLRDELNGFAIHVRFGQLDVVQVQPLRVGLGEIRLGDEAQRDEGFAKFHRAALLRLQRLL